MLSAKCEAKKLLLQLPFLAQVVCQIMVICDIKPCRNGGGQMSKPVRREQGISHNDLNWHGPPTQLGSSPNILIMMRIPAWDLCGTG